MTSTVSECVGEGLPCSKQLVGLQSGPHELFIDFTYFTVLQTRRKMMKFHLENDLAHGNRYEI